MTVVHWQAPDPAGDIARQAFRPDAAEPRVIHVRPELHRLIAAHVRAELEDRLRGGGALFAPSPRVWGVPLIVDDRLPIYPGFEIHRVRP